MTSQSQVQDQAQKRISWTDMMEDALLEFLLQESKVGKQTDNGGFKVQSFRDALAVVNKSLPPTYTGAILTEKNIQVKWNNTKKDYKDFVFLKNSSGFGWDETTQKVTGDPQVWEGLIEKNPNLRKFKDRGLRNYDKLVQLLEGTQAIGEYTTTIRKRPLAVADSDEILTPTATPTPTSGPRIAELAITACTPAATCTSAAAHTSVATPAIAASKAASTTGALKATSAGVRSKATSTTASAGASKAAVTASPAASPTAGTPTSELEVLDRHPKRLRTRPREKRSGVHDSLALLLHKMAEIGEKSFHKPGVRERAVNKLQNNFPNLHIDDLIEACNLFEDTTKCEIFMALQRPEIAKEWLHREFQKRQHIVSSNIFFRNSLHSQNAAAAATATGPTEDPIELQDPTEDPSAEDSIKDPGTECPGIEESSNKRTDVLASNFTDSDKPTPTEALPTEALVDGSTHGSTISLTKDPSNDSEES